MSTCPDQDLYSAYVDGEVPSPWKEKLEAHASKCPTCRRAVERFASVSALVRSGVPELSGDQLEASFARLSARAVPASASPRAARQLPDWFRASISVPLPALAAVFLAAVIVPSLIVARASSSRDAYLAATPAPIIQAVLADEESFRTSAVYSPDLPEVTAAALTSANRSIFRVVDFANQYARTASDESAEVIVIKLPRLARFGLDDGHAAEADGVINAVNWNEAAGPGR